MKKRKIKYSNLVLVGIFIYIVMNIVGVFFKSTIKTEVVSNEKIEESINKKGLLIRDEYLITSNMSGNIEAYVKEGDKVKKGDSIAYIYNKNISKDTITELNTLEKEVKDIKEGSNSLITEDISKLNKEIETYEKKVQIKLINENLEINKEKGELEKLVQDKSKLLKSDLNSKTMKNKEEEVSKISKTIDKNSELLKTNNSGIVSYKFDGNEEKYNSESIINLKIEDIEDEDNKYEDILNKENIKPGQPVARIIDNNKQYLAIAIEKNEKRYFEKGSGVIIKYGKNKINAKISQIYAEKDKNIVVFEISEQNIEIYDTRVAEFDIIYKSIEGIKIPKKCIVKKDNIQGVYVVSETGNAKFIEIKGISYENEDFIVIDYYNNKINGVKTVDIYDEIILEPIKVKDGSIVK